MVKKYPDTGKYSDTEKLSDGEKYSDSFTVGQKAKTSQNKVFQTLDSMESESFFLVFLDFPVI